MKETVAGAAAGLVGTIIGFPFDTIKTHMQITQCRILKTIRIIAKEEGLIGFYRGIAAPLLSLTILNTMNFTIYSKSCHLLGLDPENSHKLQEIQEGRCKTKIEWQYGLAGSVVGPFAGLLSTPFEMIKIRMQLGKKLASSSSSSSSSSASFSVSVKQYNTFTMAASIVRQNGFIGLYQGHVVNTVREVVFLSSYFFIYENCKFSLLSCLSSYASLSSPSSSSRSSSTAALISIPLSGGIAGAVGWFLSFPLDNIKSNIQTMNLDRAHLFHRKSAFEIGKHILRSRGLLALYSGVVPSVTRAFIVSSTRFSVYEYVLRLFDS
jgi:solute carrier family 25 carnitine/acylcarnitine transporter 20/29